MSTVNIMFECSMMSTSIDVPIWENKTFDEILDFIKTYNIEIGYTGKPTKNEFKTIFNGKTFVPFNLTDNIPLANKIWFSDREVSDEIIEPCIVK
jgi:hypothetical protein